MTLIGAHTRKKCHLTKLHVSFHPGSAVASTAASVAGVTRHCRHKISAVTRGSINRKFVVYRKLMVYRYYTRVDIVSIDAVCLLLYTGI